MTSQPSQQMPAQPVVAQQHLPPPPAQTMPAHMVPTAPAPLPPHTVPSMQTMPHTAPPIPPMPHAAHTLAQTMPAQQLPPVGTLPPHIPPHMVTHATPPAAFSPYQYPYQAAAHHQASGRISVGIIMLLVPLCAIAKSHCWYEAHSRNVFVLIR